MKKLTSLLVIFLVFVFFYSCNDETKKDELGISDLSPEQHKEKLTNIGIKFVDDMDGISDEPMIPVLESFFEFADNGDLENEIDIKSAPFGFLKQHTILKESPRDVLVVRSLYEEDYKSYTEIFNDLKGTYTYNYAKEVWYKTSNANEIKFLFPSSTTSSDNNAVLRIYDYSAIEANNQDIDNWDAELLKSVKYDLNVDGKSILNYSFVGSYHSDDTPSKIDITSNMKNYKWATNIDFSKPEEEMAAKYSLSKGNSVLLEMGVSAQGNFAYENVLNQIEDEVEFTEQEIINTGDVYFQVGNIKVLGKADVNKWLAEGNAADSKYDRDELSEKEFYEALASAFNDNLSLNMIYVGDNEIFAKAKVIVVEYEDWDWDWIAGDYELTTQYDIEIQFEFMDGSTIDDSYFESGFSGFINRMNEMIRKMNGDHGIEMDEIDY